MDKHFILGFFLFAAHFCLITLSYVTAKLELQWMVQSSFNGINRNVDKVAFKDSSGATQGRVINLATHIWKFFIFTLTKLYLSGSVYVLEAKFSVQKRLIKNTTRVFFYFHFKIQDWKSKFITFIFYQGYKTLFKKVVISRDTAQSSNTLLFLKASFTQYEKKQFLFLAHNILFFNLRNTNRKSTSL